MNIEFSVGFGKESDRREGDAVRNALVIGNFSGSSASGGNAIRHMLNVDPIELDAAIKRVGACATVGVGDALLQIGFQSIDDFHPDALLGQVPAFSAAMELRRALADPSKAREAAELTRQLLGIEGAPEPTPPGETASEPEASDDLFTRLLGQKASAPDTPNPAVRSTLDRLLKQALDEDAVPTPDADALELRRQLELWIASALRELLRSPDFRPLETAWRSFAWLLETVEIDETLAIWLVDVDDSDAARWAEELPRRIAAGPGSAEMLIVLRDFGDDDGSLSDLSALGAVSATVNARAFAGASATLAGLTGDIGSPIALDGSDFGAAAPDGWDDLRSGAGSVCLGFPSLLLRQPFGERTDPIDAFDFDELGNAPGHDDFLWGSAGTGLAAMSLTDTLLLEDGLLVTYNDGSGQAIKPASGAYLTDSAVDALLGRGIVPLLAERGSTRLRAPRLQSIAIRAL